MLARVLTMESTINSEGLQLTVRLNAWSPLRRFDWGVVGFRVILNAVAQRAAVMSLSDADDEARMAPRVIACVGRWVEERMSDWER